MDWSKFERKKAAAEIVGGSNALKRNVRLT